MVLFLTGLHECYRTAITSIDKYRVSFASRSLISPKQWVEGLDRYEGISYHEESRGGTKGSRPYTLHIVELYHTDSHKRLKLYQSVSAEGVRSIWEDFCRKLNLPAVEKDGTSLIKRNVEDLDKSIRELVKEGKIRIDFDPSRPPPSGLLAESKGDDVQVIAVAQELHPVDRLCLNPGQYRSTIAACVSRNFASRRDATTCPLVLEFELFQAGGPRRNGKHGLASGVRRLAIQLFDYHIPTAKSIS